MINNTTLISLMHTVNVGSEHFNYTPYAKHAALLVSCIQYVYSGHIYPITPKFKRYRSEAVRIGSLLSSFI